MPHKKKKNQGHSRSSVLDWHRTPHVAFSDNHLVDTNKTKQNYNQEKHKKIQITIPEKTNIGTKTK